MKAPSYPFLRQIGRILNSGQSRSVVLSGNIYDLFFLEDNEEGGPGDYQPLVEFLTAQWDISDLILVVYEINGPIRFERSGDYGKMKDAWLTWRTGLDGDDLAIKRMLSTRKVASVTESYDRDFETNMKNAIGNPTVALEMLRQLCLCSRSEVGGKPVLSENLLIIVEAADLVLTQGEISNMSDVDRHRVSVCHDWFSDPGFMNGEDSVVLVAESSSLINERIARLPQVLDVQIPAPDEKARRHFVSWFKRTRPEGTRLRLWSSQQALAQSTAGLSLLALMQLMKGAAHENSLLTQESVIDRVEEFIKSQLGEDIVEFKKPSHKLDSVVGFTRLKEFLDAELIPRLASSGEDALPGAAVCGPIGGGKTFIFEAVAAELDMVVLVLKNIRSQWFGQTDVLFERLRRTLEALSKVLIFVDEADTQFGGVGVGVHATERRLTGRIQAMMSDPRLRGRVVWLLMTARIQLLSPDIRRPGRVGDLIVPILDPEGDDRRAFLKWVLEPVLEEEPNAEQWAKFEEALQGESSAMYASLRSELKAKSIRAERKLSFTEILELLDDHIPPAIGEARRYQTLQALVNCTRKSLLPKDHTGPEARAAWREELALLEAKGIR